MSRALPVREVDLADIAGLDEDHWYAQEQALPTPRSITAHCKLIEQADLSYPIILDSSGRVMDGMHRVCKALMLGLARIGAVRFDVNPEPDYVGCDPDLLPYDDDLS